MACEQTFIRMLFMLVITAMTRVAANSNETCVDGRCFAEPEDIGLMQRRTGASVAIGTRGEPNRRVCANYETHENGQDEISLSKDSDLGRCKCEGTVYYGRKYVTDDKPGHGELATFDQLTVPGEYVAMSVTGSIECSNEAFAKGPWVERPTPWPKGHNGDGQMSKKKGDPLRFYFKWCWCETPAPTEQPTPAPTQAPTEQPTPAPTQAPTEQPIQIFENPTPTPTGVSCPVDYTLYSENLRAGPWAALDTLVIPGIGWEDKADTLNRHGDCTHLSGHKQEMCEKGIVFCAEQCTDNADCGYFEHFYMSQECLDSDPDVCEWVEEGCRWWKKIRAPSDVSDSGIYHEYKTCMKDGWVDKY